MVQTKVEIEMWSETDSDSSSELEMHANKRKAYPSQDIFLPLLSSPILSGIYSRVLSREAHESQIVMSWY